MSSPLEVWETKHKQSVQKNNEFKNKEITVLIGSATCENAAGANELYEVFKSKLNNMNNVYFGVTGCTGNCVNEPIVQIIKQNEISVKYKNVTVQIADEIIENHIKKGIILKQYTV